MLTNEILKMLADVEDQAGPGVEVSFRMDGAARAIRVNLRTQDHRLEQFASVIECRVSRCDLLDQVVAEAASMFRLRKKIHPLPDYIAKDNIGLARLSPSEKK